MNQATVQTAVAVLEGMYRDERERRRGGLQNGIETVIAHAVIGLEHACHQTGQVLCTRADELGERNARMIAFPQEPAVGPQARAHEACVLDKEAVKTDYFVECEAVLPCPQDGATPAFQAVARRPFTFNLEAGAAIGEQHEARCTCNEMAASAAHGFARLAGEIESQHPTQGLSAPYDRTEPARAQEIVADAMALREAWPAGEIRLRIKKKDKASKFSPISRNMVNIG